MWVECDLILVFKNLTFTVQRSEPTVKLLCKIAVALNTNSIQLEPTRHNSYLPSHVGQNLWKPAGQNSQELAGTDDIYVILGIRTRYLRRSFPRGSTLATPSPSTWHSLPIEPILATRHLLPRHQLLPFATPTKVSEFLHRVKFHSLGRFGQPFTKVRITRSHRQWPSNIFQRLLAFILIGRLLLLTYEVSQTGQSTPLQISNISDASVVVSWKQFKCGFKLIITQS